MRNEMTAQDCDREERRDAAAQDRQDRREAAEERMMRYEPRGGEPVDVDKWLTSNPDGLSADTTDEELDDLADQLQREANKLGVQVLRLHEHITALRDWMRTL